MIRLRCHLVSYTPAALSKCYHLIAQPLTDYISLIPILTCHDKDVLDLSVHCVIQLCRVFRRGFEGLDRFYRIIVTILTLRRLRSSVDSLSSASTYGRFLGPHLPVTELTINKEHVTLIYGEHLQANNPARAAFRATLRFADRTTRPVVVKFTPNILCRHAPPTCGAAHPACTYTALF